MASTRSQKGQPYQAGSYLDDESSEAKFYSPMRAVSPLTKGRTIKASPRTKATKKKIAETLPIPSYYRSIEQMYRNLDSQRSKNNKFDFGPYASPSTLKRPNNHVDPDISSTQRAVDMDESTLVSQQSIDSGGGFVIANGSIGENSRAVTYQMREIPTVCFAVNFTVTKYEQHWTVFIPMTDVLAELMRIVRLHTHPDDIKALCSWLLSVITLDFVGDTIIAAHVDHAKLHQIVVLALTRKVQSCATKIQSAVRAFLSNKRLARAAEISKRLRQSQLIAQRRASQRLGKATDQQLKKVKHQSQSVVVGMQGSNLNSLSHISSLSGHSNNSQQPPTDNNKAAGRKASTVTTNIKTNTADNGINFNPFASGPGLQATVTEVLKQRESIANNNATNSHHHPSYEGNTGNSSRRQSTMPVGGHSNAINGNGGNGMMTGVENSAIGGYNRTDQALRHLRRELTGHISVFEEELLQLRHELEEQKLTLFYSRHGHGHHKEVRYTPLEEQEAAEEEQQQSRQSQIRGRRSNAIHPSRHNHHSSIREEEDSSVSHDDTHDTTLDDSHSTSYHHPLGNHLAAHHAVVGHNSKKDAHHPHGLVGHCEEGGPAAAAAHGRLLKSQPRSTNDSHAAADINSMKEKIAHLESLLDQQRQESALSTQAALAQLIELRQQAEIKADEAAQLAAKQAMHEAELSFMQTLSAREAQLTELEAKLTAMSTEHAQRLQEVTDRQMIAEQERAEREQKANDERALALKLELQQMIDEKITPLTTTQHKKGQHADDEQDGQASVNTRLDSVNNANNADMISLSPSQQQQRPRPPAMPKNSDTGTGNKQRMISHQAPPLVAEPSFINAVPVPANDNDNEVKAKGGMWGWVMNNLGMKAANNATSSSLTASNLSAMQQIHPSSQHPILAESLPIDNGSGNGGGNGRGGRPQQRRTNRNNLDEVLDDDGGNNSITHSLHSQPNSPRTSPRNNDGNSSNRSFQSPSSNRSNSPSEAGGTSSAAAENMNNTRTPRHGGGGGGVMNLLSFTGGDLNHQIALTAAQRKQQQQQFAEQQRLESMKLRSAKQKEARSTDAAIKLQALFRAFKARQAYLAADETAVHAPETLLLIIPATHDPRMLKRAWNGAITHNRADLAAIASQRAQELLVSQQVRNVGDFDWEVIIHVIQVFAIKHDPDRPGPEIQRQRSLAVLKTLSLLEMAIKLQPKYWESLTPPEILPLALLLPPSAQQGGGGSGSSSVFSESTVDKIQQQQIESSTPGLAILRELRAAITAAAVERLVDHELVAAAFKVLYLLLCCHLNGNSRLLLVQEELCLALRRAIECHHRHDETLETLLKAVVNLCIDNRRAQDLLGSSAVPECVLMSLLNRHERNKDRSSGDQGGLNPALFQLQCRAIANLCAADHEPNQTAFCRGLYPNIFVKLLLLHAGDKATGSLEQLLRAIVAVGLNHADNKRRLQAAGVCEVLLDLLRFHSPALTDSNDETRSGNPRVASALLWALSHLTVASRAYRLVHQRVVATLAALQGQHELRQCEQGQSGSMFSSAMASLGNGDLHGALQQELHIALERLMRLNGDNNNGHSSPTDHGGMLMKPDTPLVARAHFQQSPEHF